MFRPCRLLLFLSFFVFFLAVCIVMIAMNGIWGNIEPEKTDRQTLVRIMQIRDFRQFSPDLIERLTLQAEQEFGRRSPNRPVFELPSWKKRIHVYFHTNRSEQTAYLERNLTKMARIRYFQWMYEYDSATPLQKAALMNDAVEDVRYWQEIYFEYVRFLGQPEPTPAELYQDFLRMIEDFKTDASPEETALIDSFTRDISRVLFAGEVQRSLMNLFTPQN